MAAEGRHPLNKGGALGGWLRLEINCCSHFRYGSTARAAGRDGAEIDRHFGEAADHAVVQRSQQRAVGMAMFIEAKFFRSSLVPAVAFPPGVIERQCPVVVSHSPGLGTDRYVARPASVCAC